MKDSFGRALKKSRKAHGLSQNDFSATSSRSYLSLLERGKRSPTIEKIESLASTMGVHGLTLIAVTYLYLDKSLDLDSLLKKVRTEAEVILKSDK